MQATIDYVSDRSAALVLAPEPDDVSIGSAVCIKVGVRYLAATAAHNLEGITDLGKIRILPRGQRGRGESGILGFHCAKERDVAVFEIDPRYAHFSSLRFLSLGDLLCGQRYEPQVAFLLQGYPCQEVSLHSPDDFEPLSLGLITISVVPANGADVLAVEYPPQSGADSGLVLAGPEGISGGGVWRFPPFESGALWSPESARLVAIPVSWMRSENQELGEPIEFWLQLVATKFSDLTEIVSDAFSLPLVRRPGHPTPP